MKYYKWFVVALLVGIILIGLYPHVAAHAQVQSIRISDGSWTIVEQPKTIPQLIALYSTLYGVSGETMTKVLDCESSFNPGAYNATDGHGGSRGIAQFQTTTFDTFAVKAGLIDPNVWSAEDSIHVMAYMFSIDKATAWSCYNKYF